MIHNLAKILSFGLILVVYVFALASVGECREIIFVVNTGSSMQNSDPLHVVQDGLTWSLESFSSEDEAGIITFNDNVTFARPLSKIKDETNNIFSFNYYGGSDAGSALLKAIDILAQKFDTERNIVVISNGEFFLSDSAEASKSVENFKSGLQQAKWLNIPVQIINLRYEGNAQNFYSFSKYAEEIPCSDFEFMTTLRTVLHNNFQTSHINLPIKKSSEGSLTCKMPLVSAKHVKLLLLSSNVGTCELKTEGAESVINKNFVKIFKLNSPDTTDFEFNINYPEGTGLTLDAIAEVEGELQMNFVPAIFSDNVLEITPVCSENNEKKIFDDEYFNGKSLRVKIDDKNTFGEVQDGTIKISIDNAEEIITVQKIHFEDLGVKFIGNDFGQIKTSADNYLAWILGAAALTLILILSYRLHKKNQSRKFDTFKKVSYEKISPFSEVKKNLIRSKSVSYKGELVIYVTKNPNDEYIAPKIFNLFRLNSSESVSVAEVLKSCDVGFDFKDAQEIKISPSANGIYVENNSDCNVVKLNNPIPKGSYVELCHEDSIGLAAKDKATELFVTYKSLKPN